MSIDPTRSGWSSFLPKRAPSSPSSFKSMDVDGEVYAGPIAKPSVSSGRSVRTGRSSTVSSGTSFSSKPPLHSTLNEEGEAEAGEERRREDAATQHAPVRRKKRESGASSAHNYVKQRLAQLQGRKKKADDTPAKAVKRKSDGWEGEGESYKRGRDVDEDGDQIMGSGKRSLTQIRKKFMSM